MLTVKEAISQAKKDLREVFDTEHVTDIMLEEVDVEDSSGNWLITLSFIRIETDPPSGSYVNVKSAFMQRSRRLFKIVEINAETGKMVRISHRETGLAA